MNGDAIWVGTWARKRHINWLELRSVLTALQILQFRLRNKTVLFMLGNTNAVAYLSRQRGTRFCSLLRLGSPDSEAGPRAEGNFISASIAGQANVLAHMVSRVDQIIPTEWSLTSRAYQWKQSVLLGATLIGTVRKCQPHPPEVRVSVSGCEGMGDGRATVSMAAGDSVRIPSSQSDVEVPQKTTGRGNVSQFSGSAMVGSSQVGPSVMHSFHTRDGEVSNRGSSSPTPALGPRVRASPSIGPPADTFGEDNLRQQGFSDNVMERIRNSRALSIRKHYRSQ